MKNCRIISIIAVSVLALSLTNCSKDTTGVLRIHKYINQSGVQVAMVGEGFGNVPDSLVINNGETYECSLRYPSMNDGYYEKFPYNFGNRDNEAEYIPLKVYYNKDICVSYTYKDEGKNPAGVDRGSYEVQRKEKRNLITVIYTYTFTPEDYQNAINAQSNSEML